MRMTGDPNLFVILRPSAYIIGYLRILVDVFLSGDPLIDTAGVPQTRFAARRCYPAPPVDSRSATYSGRALA